MPENFDPGPGFVCFSQPTQHYTHRNLWASGHEMFQIIKYSVVNKTKLLSEKQQFYGVKWDQHHGCV